VSRDKYEEKMTTQDWLDWAFAKQGLEPEQKLALISMALKANDTGGGRVTLGYLAQGMSCGLAEVVGHLAVLVRRRLIIFTYRPSPSDDDATNDQIEFGLFISTRPT
jgi:hypothetical protein